MTEEDTAGLLLPMSSEVRAHHNRKARRAMRQMALALDIDPERPEYRDPSVMWEEIKRRVAGGIMTSPQSTPPPVGDPFALFLTGRCSGSLETPHREWEQTFVAKEGSGRPIDEFEARRIIAQFKADDRVRICQQCGEEITTWSSDMTRMSIFTEQQRQQGKSDMVRGLM